MLIFLLIAGLLVVALCILGIILVQVYKENLKRWTTNWLIRSGSTPVPGEPGNPANTVYLDDMSFNVRVVISFLLGSLALIVLGLMLVAGGISLFSLFI